MGRNPEPGWTGGVSEPTGARRFAGGIRWQPTDTGWTPFALEEVGTGSDGRLDRQALTKVPPSPEADDGEPIRYRQCDCLRTGNHERTRSGTGELPLATREYAKPLAAHGTEDTGRQVAQSVTPLAGVLPEVHSTSGLHAVPTNNTRNAKCLSPITNSGKMK